jgi:hypothetical protein
MFQFQRSMFQVPCSKLNLKSEIKNLKTWNLELGIRNLKSAF